MEFSLWYTYSYAIGGRMIKRWVDDWVVGLIVGGIMVGLISLAYWLFG